MPNKSDRFTIIKLQYISGIFRNGFSRCGVFLFSICVLLCLFIFLLDFEVNGIWHLLSVLPAFQRIVRWNSVRTCVASHWYYCYYYHCIIHSLVGWENARHFCKVPSSQPPYLIIWYVLRRKFRLVLYHCNMMLLSIPIWKHNNQLIFIWFSSIFLTLSCYIRDRDGIFIQLCWNLWNRF